jgi:hypothetical protein
MRPGAQAALNKNVDYQEATRAFQLTLVDEALRQTNNVASRAALRIGVSKAYIHMLVNGKARLPRKGKRPKEVKQAKVDE